MATPSMAPNELDRDRTKTPQPNANANGGPELAPGRDAPSSKLQAPDKPVPSGLVAKKDGDGAKAPPAPIDPKNAVVPPTETKPATPPPASAAKSAGPPVTAPPETTPASGVTWDSFWDGTGGNLVRTGLEVSRFVPGWGFIGGLGADLIELKQNEDSLADLPKGEAQEDMKKLVLARQCLVAFNNILGHARYCVTLFQDGALGSLVGAEMLVITEPVLETMNAINIVTSTAQLAFDTGLAVNASLESDKYGAGTKEYNAYHDLAVNFGLNAVGDGVGLFLDIADMATGSFANAAAIKEAKEALQLVVPVAKKMRVALVPLVKNWIGVWGPAFYKAMEDGLKGPAPRPGATNATNATNAIGAQVGPHGLSRASAGSIMLGEIDHIESAFRIGDPIVQRALHMPGDLANDVQKMVKQLYPAKDPLIWMRDKLAAGIREGTERTSHLLEIRTGAQKAEQAAQKGSSAVDSVLAAVERVHMPKITTSQTNLGDNALAHAASGLIDGAKGIGAGAANAALAHLQPALDELKATAKQEATRVKADMDWVVKFAAAYQAAINEQTAKIAQMGALFAEKLSHCKNVEDVFNLLLGVGAKAIGSDEITVEDLRQVWHEIRGLIDQGFDVAHQVATGTGGAPKLAGAQPTTPAPAAPAPAHA